MACQSDKVEWVLDGGFLDAIPPQLISVVSEDPESLLLSFDEPILLQTLIKLDNYSIEPELAILNIETVNEQHQLIRLNTVTQIPQQAYILTVRHLTDRYHNLIDPLHNQQSFIGYGTRDESAPAFIGIQDGARILGQTVQLE